jgi:hypothetical protein
MANAVGTQITWNCERKFQLSSNLIFSRTSTENTVSS